MSALDHNIRWWRERLEIEARLSSDDLDELEDHLRILIEEETRGGCSEHTAFERAVKQLSDLESLSDVWVSAPLDPRAPDPYASTGRPIGWTPPERRNTLGEFMTSVVQDLRYTIRNLLKKPGFAVAVVLVLAIGIGINSAMFSLIYGILWRPPNLERPEEIVVLASVVDEGRTTDGLSYLDFQDFSRETSVVSGLALHFPVSMQLRASSGDPTGADDGASMTSSASVWGSVTSTNFFETLGVRPFMGRSFGSQEVDSWNEGSVEPVVVIAHSLWQRQLGADPDIVGREILLNGESFTVIGVAPPGFRGAHALLTSELFLPLSVAALISPTSREVLEDRKRRTLWAVGRLAPGVTIGQAEMRFQEVAAQLAREYPDSNEGVGVAIHPESYSRMGMGSGPVMRLASIVMLVSVALVLLVACVNVANLVLARASARRREISIRLAMGASRGRVIRQLLTESLVLALLGGAAGLLIAVASMRVLAASVTGVSLPVFFDPALDPRVLLYALGLTLATSLFFGLMPALQVSGSEWGASLRSEGRALSDGKGSGGMRRVLVIAQVAACLVLLMVAALFARSLQNVVGVDVGFEPQNRIAASADLAQHGYDGERRAQFYRDMKERVQALPGVHSATWAMPLPLDTFASNAFVYVDGFERGSTPGGNDSFEVLYSLVDESYFETLGTEILLGRAIEASDREDRVAVAVVNQTMAERFWPDTNPIGQRFRLDSPDSPPHEVVGVAADGKYRQVSEDPLPYVYLAYEQGGSARLALSATLVVHSAQPPAALAEQLRAEARALDEAVALPNLRTLEDHLRRSAFLPATAAAVLVFRFRAHRFGPRHHRALWLALLLRAATDRRDRFAYCDGRDAAPRDDQSAGSGPAPDGCGSCGWLGRRAGCWPSGGRSLVQRQRHRPGELSPRAAGVGCRGVAGMLGACTSSDPSGSDHCASSRVRASSLVRCVQGLACPSAGRGCSSRRNSTLSENAGSLVMPR